MAHLASVSRAVRTSKDRRGRRRTFRTFLKGSARDMVGQVDGPKLVLYSKPECSLCEGMKAKVEAVLDAAQYTGGALSGMNLEVRDASTKESWWELHGGNVPVLCLAVADREEEIRLPKPAVRLNASRLGKRIEDQISGSLPND